MPEPKIITPDSWWGGTEEDQQFFEDWMLEHGLWPEPGDANEFFVINVIDLGDEIELEEHRTDKSGKAIFEGLKPKLFTRRIKPNRPLNCPSIYQKQGFDPFKKASKSLVVKDKICCIDIDGCLIPFGGHNPLNNGKPTKESVEVLYNLIKNGYRLVLHSTWRSDRLNEAYELFAKAGIPLYAHVSISEESKSKAIIDWLFDNYESAWPDDILVIDDDEVFVRNTRHIRPDFRVGLTWSDYSDSKPHLP